MMKKLLFLVLLALTFCFCSRQDNMVHIDVAQSMNTTLTRKLSNVIKTLNYVPLETDSNCLVDNYFKVALFDKDIAIISKRRILLFDRETGKFKQEVLHFGNDPDGHAGTRVGRGMVANEKAGYVFINERNKRVSAYHVYTGKRITIPVGTIKSFAYTDDNSFLTTAFNFDGQYQVKMWFYDNHQCVDSIPNHWKFKLMSNAMTIITDDEIFYRSNNHTYFKDATNDTVFVVTDTLTPAFAFAPSSSLPQIDLREHPETMYQKMKELYFVDNIVEDADYIYYTIKYKDRGYNLIYDKTSGEGGLLKEGFTNDIDGKINLFPDHITDRGEYVFVLNPALLSEEELNKCHLKADDNPMVVIGETW